MSFYFIVNPTAGKGMGEKIVGYLSNYLANKKVSCKIALTEYAGHGVILAKEVVN